MKLKEIPVKIYFALEDVYYKIMDQLNKVIPVYDYFITPIESRGVPSFPVAVIILLALIALVFLLLSPQAFLFKAMVYSQSNPLSGVTVEVYDADGNKVAEEVTGANGISSFSNLSRVLLSFNASKEGFLPGGAWADLGKQDSVSIELSCGGGACAAPCSEDLDCPSGVKCVSGFCTLWKCGDNKCDSALGETCSSCEKDCGPCAPIKCKAPQKYEVSFKKCITTCEDVMPGQGATYNALSKRCEVTNNFDSTGDLYVHVTDSVTGMPVRARIELYDKNTRLKISFTGSNASNQFGDLTAREITIDSMVYAIAVADGYWAYDGSVLNNFVRITPQPNSMNIMMVRQLPENTGISVIRVMDASTHALIPATIKLFYSGSVTPFNTTFTATGVLEAVLQKGVPYYAKANASGYFEGRSIEFYAETPVNISLVKADAPNTASLSVKVKDEYGSTVSGATVGLFDPTTGEPIYEPKTTGTGGIVSWGPSSGEPLHKGFPVNITALLEDKSGSLEVNLTNSTNSVDLFLEINWGFLHLTALDLEELNQGRETVVEVLFKASYNGTPLSECYGSNCSLRVKSRPKTNWVEVDADGYFPARAPYSNVTRNSDKYDVIYLTPYSMVENINVTFLGLFNDNGNGPIQNGSIISFGKDYFARYSVYANCSLPADSRAGLYVRVVNESINDASITALNPAPNQFLFTNFSSTYSTASCYNTPFFSGAKWGYADYLTQGNLFCSREIEYEVNVPVVRKYGLLQLFDWAGLQKSGSFVRDPLDPDYNLKFETPSKKWCAAATYYNAYSVEDPTRTCTEDWSECITVTFRQGNRVGNDNEFNAISISENRSHNIPFNPVYIYYTVEGVPAREHTMLEFSAMEGHVELVSVSYSTDSGEKSYSVGGSSFSVDVTEAVSGAAYRGSFSGTVVLLPVAETPFEGIMLRLGTVDSQVLLHYATLHIKRIPFSEEPYCWIEPLQAFYASAPASHSVVIHYNNLIQPLSGTIPVSCTDSTTQASGCTGTQGSCAATCAFSSIGSKVVSAQPPSVGDACKANALVDAGPRCSIQASAESVAAGDYVELTILYNDLNSAPPNGVINVECEPGTTATAAPCDGTSGACTASCVFSSPGLKQPQVVFGGASCASAPIQVVESKYASLSTLFSQENYSSNTVSEGGDGFEAISIEDCPGPLYSEGNCNYSALKESFSITLFAPATAGTTALAPATTGTTALSLATTITRTIRTTTTTERRFCPEILVCGVDGRTYSNPCAAEDAGVAIAYYGTCGLHVETVTGARIKVEVNPSDNLWPLTVRFKDPDTLGWTTPVNIVNGEWVPVPFSANAGQVVEGEIFFKTLAEGTPSIALSFDNYGNDSITAKTNSIKVLKILPGGGGWDFSQYDCFNGINVTCNSSGLFLGCSNAFLMVDPVFPADAVSLTLFEHNGSSILFGTDSEDGSAGCYDWSDKTILKYNTEYGGCPTQFKAKANFVAGSHMRLSFGCSQYAGGVVKYIDVAVLNFSQNNLYRTDLYENAFSPYAWDTSYAANNLAASRALWSTYNPAAKKPVIGVLVNQKQQLSAGSEPSSTEKFNVVLQSGNYPSSTTVEVNPAGATPFAYDENSGSLSAKAGGLSVAYTEFGYLNNLTKLVETELAKAQEIVKATACRRSYTQLWYCQPCTGGNCTYTDSDGNNWDCRNSLEAWLNVTIHYEDQEVQCDADYCNNTFNCNPSIPWVPGNLSCSLTQPLHGSVFQCDSRCVKASDTEAFWNVACGENFTLRDPAAASFCTDLGDGSYLCNCNCTALTQMLCNVPDPPPRCSDGITSCTELFFSCDTYCSMPNCDPFCSPQGTKTIQVPVVDETNWLNSSTLQLIQITLNSIPGNCQPLNTLKPGQAFTYSFVFVPVKDVTAATFLSAGVAPPQTLCPWRAQTGAYLIQFSTTDGTNWQKSAQRITLGSDAYVPPLYCYKNQDVPMCSLLYADYSVPYSDCVNSITQRGSFSSWSVGAVGDGILLPPSPWIFAVSKNGFIAHFSSAQTSYVCDHGCDCAAVVYWFDVWYPKSGFHQGVSTQAGCGSNTAIDVNTAEGRLIIYIGGDGSYWLASWS
jgi:hypothetical protein